MCTYIQEKTFDHLKNTYLACCINIAFDAFSFGGSPLLSKIDKKGWPKGEKQT